MLESTKKQSAPAANGGPRLLVVDDDQASREFLEQGLSRAGFDVSSAMDARTALNVLQCEPVELVLLSPAVSGMSGMDLLRLLRATHSAAELPVVMVTGGEHRQRIVEALEQGANDYVTKPIDFPLALERIQSQLDRRRVRRICAAAVTEGFWDWNVRSGCVAYSARWKELLGLGESTRTADPRVWLDRVHREDHQRLLEQLAACQAVGGPSALSSEHRLRHESGRYRWMICRASLLRDDDGAAERIVGSHVDITQTKCHDALTDLPNRFAFLEELAEAIAIANESPERRFGVLTIDLDRFKSINDSLGYAAGDTMLREIGRRLQRAVRGAAGRRRADFVARLGGDEFGIILGEALEQTNAHGAATRILNLLQEPFTLADRNVVISASVGAASYTPSPSAMPSQTLSDAETAMHRAKEMGKSCVVFFEEGLRRQIEHRLHLEHEMRGALERDEFLLYYQPKVDLGLYEITGFEALIRWNHPQRGLIPPGHFIPIAEETGHIVPLGHWTLAQACRQMRSWRDASPWPPLYDMSVNLSIKQILTPGFVSTVETVLRETGLDSGHLHLEVTETVFIQDVKLVAGILGDLKALGVGLSLDDFGTGYSSLQYLVSLPIDFLKIDRSFVSRMCQEEQSLEVVKTIIALARRLGMGLIAEGVETMAQAQILRDLGCQYAQGYYFGKPLPPDEAVTLLGTRPVLPMANRVILSQ